MARKAMIEKEKYKLERSLRYKAHRDELRARAKDLRLSPEEREQASVQLQKLPRKTSLTAVRNRCLVTGRSRGYLRKFKMSRLAVRENANRGLLPGVTKASW